MSRKKLLIVEDEIIIGLTFSKYLNSKGYICNLVLDYNQAIEHLANKQYDIVLVDIKLKGQKTGLDLAKHINTEFSIPFVFITSFMSPQTIEKARTLKPKGFLTKPINKESLYTTLEMIELNQSTVSEYIIIKDGKNVLRIKKQDILFIKSDHVYVSILTKYNSKPYLIRNSLQNMLSLLNHEDFFQVHRCYIVYLRAINKINRTELYINTNRIPIGKTRQKELNQKIKYLDKV